MIKGVIFDFDGVVLDSMPQHLKAWKYAFARAGHEIDDLDFLKMEGRGVDALARDMAQKKNVDMTQLPQIIRDKIDYYERNLHIIFYDGFFELLDFLKSKQIKMGVVTGGSRNRILKILKEHLNGYFSIVVTADDVQNTKPYPEPYIKGAEMLDLKKEECVIIENAPMGIEAGRKAGIFVYAIETTLGKEYLQEADQIVHSFYELRSRIEKRLDK